MRWTLPAAADLENIKNYLLKNYPHVAEVTVRAIYQRIVSQNSAEKMKSQPTAYAT